MAVIISNWWFGRMTIDQAHKIIAEKEAYTTKNGWYQCAICGHPSEPNVDKLLVYRRHEQWCIVGQALRTIHHTIKV